MLEPSFLSGFTLGVIVTIMVLLLLLPRRDADQQPETHPDADPGDSPPPSVRPDSALAIDDPPPEWTVAGSEEPTVDPDRDRRTFDEPVPCEWCGALSRRVTTDGLCPSCAGDAPENLYYDTDDP